MARQQGWFALILALAIAAGSVLVNPGYPLELGLDLRGGSQLTLELQPAGDITKVKPEQLEAVKAVLDGRVNGLGVAESTLQTVGDNQLVLQLPGVTDPSEAARKLGERGVLEFRVQKPGSEESLRVLLQLRNNLERLIELNKNGNASDLTNQEKSLSSEELAQFQKELDSEGTSGSEREEFQQQLDRANEEIADLFDPIGLTGTDLKNAGSQQQQNGSSWEVTLTFQPEGGDKFADLTRSIAGTDRRLAIVLDGKSISEANVGPQFKAAGITGGSAVITGRFTSKRAGEIAVLLRGGSLPLPIEILEVRTIGPSLGAENVRRSLIAALAGLVLVAIFMLLVYRLAGLVAVLALSLYAIFNLAAYELIGVTLTLPGTAGFILSIGMAVDANVLIFERIKDELRRGNTLVRSIDTGFSQAFSSIVDGHITTLISCAALFFLGTGLVKGFAATLGIGVLLSLFTALTCTRTILRFLMSYQSLRRPTNFLPSGQLPSSAA